MAQANDEFEDAQAQIYSQAELERLECQTLREDTSETNEHSSDDNIPHLEPNKQSFYTIEANTTQMTSTDALELLQSLNEEQFAIFNKI